MLTDSFQGIEIAPVSVVKQAARDFAAALNETPEFQRFDQAACAFRRDPTAQPALQALQQKQQDWQAVLMLNALSPEQQAELDRLQQAVDAHPAIQAYFEAQAGLTELCQTLGDALSQATGLNYAAVCGRNCCG